MSLSKAVTDRIPDAAVRMIQAAIDGIVPTVDMDPEKVYEVVKAVEDAIISVITEIDVKESGGTVSCRVLSNKLRMIAERSDLAPVITAEINGIAQSIASLVRLSSRNGARRGLRALEPREFLKRNGARRGLRALEPRVFEREERV